MTESAKETEEAATKASRPLFVVGICSRGRQDLLNRLLSSISQQIGAEDRPIEVIIVDNNSSPEIDELECTARAGVTCHVRHEPRAGLVWARNTLFDAVEDLGAAWMIGLDDDEWVAPDWLASWLEAISLGEALILVGRAQLIHSPGGSIFRTLRQYREPVAGVPARLLGTCNYAINEEVFSRDCGLGMRFHPLFNETGGEDAEFMLRAKRQHNVIAFGWPHAHAYEDRDGPRAEVGYMLKRVLQDRINNFMIARLHHDMGLMNDEQSFPLIVLRRTNRSIVYGAGRFLLGIVKLPLGLRTAGREFGRALEHFVQAFAIVPYLSGWRRRGYGANATEA